MFTTEMQYVLVRYMLNELGDEAANVGIIAVTNDPPRVLSKFLEDPTLKSRADARVRRDAVERFSASAKERTALGDIGTGAGQFLADVVFDRIKEIGGNVVRVSLPRSVLTNDVESEFELLFSQLVAPASSAIAQRELRPRDPLGGLRKEASSALVRAFRQGYGRPLSRDNFSKSHHVKGAIHENVFDLAVISGTKRKRREHLFQHLLMLHDPEESFTQAAGLVWRWGDIKAANHADRQLTAVLYERGDHNARGVVDATKLLRKQNIDVARLHDLPSLVRKMDNQGRLF
jgi:hypothetical protein